MNQVTFFFPQIPFPPKSGAHKRCLAMLRGLNEIGCDVTLLLSNLYSEPEWSNKLPTTTEVGGVRKIGFYEFSSFDTWFVEKVRAYYRRRARLRATNPPVNSALHSPPGMRRWFARALDNASPDAVIINYAYWDGLLPPRRKKSLRKIIETHDLLTLNVQMHGAVNARLMKPPMHAQQIDDQLLREDFFETLGLSALPEEFQVYDKYDYTIAISPKESEIIRRSTRKTRVALIPMPQEPFHHPNTYTGPGLFATGPNPFNVQGYFFFVKRVLPQVLAHAPSFSLQVTGYCCKLVAPTDGVTLAGFVPDLTPIYENARFAICPIWGGTGQQVKIVEAMGHGLPVIALRTSAEGSPMVHGVNGLVACDADEFAAHVLELWNNPERCRQLGRAARETIATGFTRPRFLEAVSCIVNT